MVAWLRAVSARLTQDRNDHLREVKEAQHTDFKGEVIVSFNVYHAGHLSLLQVAKSSGIPAIDQFSLDMVRRASPLPPPPPDSPEADLKSSLSIRSGSAMPRCPREAQRP
jgi:TonB family protein